MNSRIVRYPGSMPVRHLPFLVMLLCMMSSLVSIAQRSTFDIFKGEEKIGSILVDRIVDGDRAFYSMTSTSTINMIWDRIIHTSTTAEYLNDLLVACRSIVKVNDSMRDSSSMSLRSGVAHCYVHPERFTHPDPLNAWTTARMYFEEPVHAPHIFVESVLKDCPLVRSGEGTYTLTFPNRARNHYTYANGELREIRVERTFFDLVFRKV